jgi:hypothetical protein
VVWGPPDGKVAVSWDGRQPRTVSRVDSPPVGQASHLLEQKEGNPTMQDMIIFPKTRGCREAIAAGRGASTFGTVDAIVVVHRLVVQH